MTQHSDRLLKGMVCAWLVTVAGCACFDDQCCDQGMPCRGCPGSFVTPMCFGYHSTCWRPWPEECPPCPAYAAATGFAEQIGKPIPAVPVIPYEIPDATREAPNIIPVPAPEPPLPTPQLPPEGAGAPRSSDQGFIQPSGEYSSRRHWVEAGFISRPSR